MNLGQLYILRAPQTGFDEARLAVGFEDQVSFVDSVGLHGREATELEEEVMVLEGGDGREEQYFVHVSVTLLRRGCGLTSSLSYEGSLYGECTG